MGLGVFYECLVKLYESNCGSPPKQEERLCSMLCRRS